MLLRAIGAGWLAALALFPGSARAGEKPMGDVARELNALFPTLESLMYGRAVTVMGDSAGVDSTRTVVASWRRLPSVADRNRVRSFLLTRLQVDSLRVVHLTAR